MCFVYALFLFLKSQFDVVNDWGGLFILLYMLNLSLMTLNYLKKEDWSARETSCHDVKLAQVN